MYLFVDGVSGVSLFAIHTNWQSGQPDPGDGGCVVITQNNEWLVHNCGAELKYVCQS